MLVKFAKLPFVMYSITVVSINQSLVVIDAELDRDNNGSIFPATAIRRRLKPLDARTDLRTRLNWW
ncbi:hypothetical protein A2U01_0081085 [Trifolium medium]|uniref:Uncharacterized protein n=1 Tax=Trifolium medium TaxID=97028 RepID=A0A392THZ5_9FABA|nr:hypothetical protein [Trifolium medium]